MIRCSAALAGEVVPSERAWHNRKRMKNYTEQRDGGWYVSGTRVSLDSIVTAFRNGASPESILESFDTLTLEQVYGAITFYLANQPAVDAYLIRQQQRIEEMRRRAEPLPPDLRARLEAARAELHVSRGD
jgi:uncharacterized protein (DUF433 family)